MPDPPDILYTYTYARTYARTYSRGEYRIVRMIPTYSLQQCRQIPEKKKEHQTNYEQDTTHRPPEQGRTCSEIMCDTFWNGIRIHTYALTAVRGMI